MKTRKTKTPKQKIKEDLDDALKKLVKLRDKNTCQHCGKYVTGSNCHGSHVKPISRSGRLAFDPLNVKVMCMHCHMHWWHKNPTEAGEWFKNKFPDRLEYLDNKLLEYDSMGTITMAEYEDMLSHINNELKKYD